MFSGIIEELGQVIEVGAGSITIEAPVVVSDTQVSDSIAVNGACLTVARVSGISFTADVMPETFRCTTLGALSPGDSVNLERAVTPSTRLGGHLVLGHVDGVGRVASFTAEGAAFILTVEAPRDLMRYVAPKGSIAIDGVSLTVARLFDSSFSVSLVTYTCSNTTLGRTRPGQQVNLEVDVLARYIERLQQTQPVSRQGITWGLLEQNGFI
ncbi:MAG TPA: riboflavin synthase [Dehalococcoidia bacterium]|nr:riboflavin synthase [Dehalococcoidia bacterium]